MQNLRSSTLLATAATFFGLASTAHAQSFQGIGDLPGGLVESLAVGVSADGSTVVGRSHVDGGYEAVRWRNGVLLGLGDLGGGPFESTAYGASADGSVIVGTGRDASTQRGVRWDDTTMSQPPQLPGLGGYSELRGVSSDGQTMCGFHSDGLITGYVNISGVRIDGGVLTGLPYIVPGTAQLDSGCYGQPSEDGRVLSGRVRLGGIGYQACYWQDTTLVLLPQLSGAPGTPYSQCLAISGDGSVQVGVSVSVDSPNYAQGEACRWEAGVAQSLGSLPGASKRGLARSANRNGSVVVGTAQDSGGTMIAFIWDAQRGMRDLKAVLQTEHGLNLSGWTLINAHAITPAGDVIVGWGTNPAGFLEGWVARLGCATVASYCTAGTTTNGCNAMLSASGTPSASGAGSFVITANGVEGQKQGLLFYGVSGAAISAWGTTTSFLCVKAPTQRMAVQNSGGTAGACDGLLASDWNAYIAANPTALGTPFAFGDALYVQAWFRDPPSPKTTALSNAVSVTVCP
jgi:uncharacterized membrane protein